MGEGHSTLWSKGGYSHTKWMGYPGTFASFLHVIGPPQCRWWMDGVGRFSGIACHLNIHSTYMVTYLGNEKGFSNPQKQFRQSSLLRQLAHA